MRYARIEDGEVKEVINFNPKGCFVESIVNQFIECDEDITQKHIYKDGKFEKKKEKTLTKDEINQGIIYELNQSNEKLVRLIEDIAEFVEELGFKIPDVQKKLIKTRRNKRSKLKL
jgi:hypothetical protein